ncbi:MAG: CHAT domain-containing protein [Acidobacteriota bacterium]
MRRIFALAFLAGLAATAAQGQLSGLADCPLDPGLQGLYKQCEQDNHGLKPETCSTLRALAHFSRDESESARTILTQELAIPAASLEKMMPWLNFLGMSLIDLDDSPPACTRAQGFRLVGLASSGLFDSLKHPETVLLFGRVAQWSEVLMGELEKRLDPEARPAVRIFSRAVVELTEKAQFSELLQMNLASNPIIAMIAGRVAPSDPTVEQLAAKEVQLQVDMAIELAQAGKLAQAREVIPRAVALADSEPEKALLQLRAGVRLISVGHLEEGLYFLKQVEGTMAGSPTTKENQTIRSIARWFVALAHNELNLEPIPGLEEVRLLEGELGDIMDAFGRSILEQDSSALITAAKEIAQILASGDVGHQEIEPVMQVIEQVLPGLDTGAGTARYQTADWTIPIAEAPGLKSYPDYLLKTMELLVLERYEDAAAEAKEFITHYPRYNNVYLLPLVAIKQWQAGERAGAIATNLAAVEALEKLVQTFRVDELQTAFVDDKVFFPFRLALEMSAAEGRAEEAFNFAERLRSWTLRRLLGGTRTRDSPIENALGDADRRLLLEIRKLEKTVRQSGHAHEAQETLTRQRARFAARRLERKLGTDRPGAMAQVEPISLQDLQSEVLDSDTTVLVYAAGIDGLWAWVVDRESKEMFYLPVSKAELERLACLAAEQRRLGTRGTEHLSSCRGPSDSTSEALYTRLIEPLANYLRKNNLIIIPTGILNHISFAALRNPQTKKYLIQDFALSLAPSATALKQLLASGQAEGQVKTLILGDPTTDWESLAGAEHEAKEVGKLLGTTPRIGRDATERAVHDQAGNLDVLHLAAHGQYTADNPIFSGIILGPGDGHDGRLEMHEVWDGLDLNGTRLVALSGCETAISETTRGDEVIGLTQAFLVAGSRAVLSTLWSVHDDASAALMVAFYRHLRSGLSVSKALQTAQQELLENPDYSEPFYWAGYTLTGDPQTRWP